MKLNNSNKATALKATEEIKNSFKLKTDYSNKD
jgi:hypothetical protein